MDYAVDGRRSVDELCNLFQSALDAAGWSKEVVCYQSGQTNPILAFTSPATRSATSKKPVDSFWILGGIHGEEPAPPEALANELPRLIELGQSVPIVLLPLLNPQARRRDWRYENEYRDFHRGQSVTAFTPPISATATQVTSWIKQAQINYPPLLVIDHHEDRVVDQDNLRSCYVYMSGGNSATSMIARKVIDALSQVGMPIAASGQSRFGETIHNGVIANAADGSVDAYLSSPSNAVIVVETTIPLVDPIPLPARIAAHQAVIRRYPYLWSLASS